MAHSEQSTAFWPQWHINPAPEPVKSPKPVSVKAPVKPKQKKKPVVARPKYEIAPASVPGQFVSPKRPSLEVRSNLKVGDVVKLGFIRQPLDKEEPTKILFSPFKRPLGTERLWVSISHVTGSGGYRGVLNNHPVFTPALNFGDEVIFTAEQIIEIKSVDPVVAKISSTKTASKK